MQDGATGFSGGAAEPYKPQAEQTFDSTRLCAPPRLGSSDSLDFSIRTDHNYKSNETKLEVDPELVKGGAGTRIVTLHFTSEGGASVRSAQRPRNVTN